MSFEYITNKNITKKLSSDDVEKLAERISSDFDNYNKRRRQNLKKMLQKNLMMTKKKNTNLGKLKLECVKLICFTRF